MPCRDYPPAYSESAVDSQIIAKQSEELDKLKKENTDKEAMLCSVCRILETQNFDFGTNPLLDEWWTKHKEEDRKREEAEATAKAARLARNLRRQRAIEIAETKKLFELSNADKKLLREFNIL